MSARGFSTNWPNYNPFPIPALSGLRTYLLLHGLADGGGELASLVQTGSKQTGDLLNDRVGGQEGVVALGCTCQKRDE